jgi:hypothetical protein
LLRANRRLSATPYTRSGADSGNPVLAQIVPSPAGFALEGRAIRRREPNATRQTRQARAVCRSARAITALLGLSERAAAAGGRAPIAFLIVPSAV